MSEETAVGAFVCSCGDTCSIDLEMARERIKGVEMAASSDLLCGTDTLGDICGVVEDRDLETVIATCPADVGQEHLERIERETDATVEFVDQREGAGWVHEEAVATEKTARLVTAAGASLDDGESQPMVGADVGRSVAVVGDPTLAASLPEMADVTLIANGQELDDAEFDRSDVRLERGRVVDVSGSLGEFEVVLEARVTDDCIDCMECLRAGPDESMTKTPVDVEPGTAGGEWVDVCPTDAIDLDGVRRTRSFDQVVYADGDDPAPGGTTGYHTDDGPGTVAAMTGLLVADRPSPLDLEMDVCASGDSGQEGCTACHEACPHDAVSRPAVDEVAFDLSACQHCGACTSACPTGAVSLTTRPNDHLAREVEALLDTEPSSGLLDWSGPALERQIVAFVCSERAERALTRYGTLAARSDEDVTYPPILPVQVDCTDTVGEAHVLHALAAGADGVAICGCGTACTHSGPEPKADLVDRLNTATTDLGLGERVTFLAPDPDGFEAFRKSLSAFVDGCPETPITPGEHEASARILGESDDASATHDWALESVRAILETVDPDRDVIRGLDSFGRITVSDACGLTPTCSNLCPTDALRREEGRLEFDHANCVNCGLCETGCPESAITMESGLDLELLPEANDGNGWQTVYEDDLFECRGCGTPFASTATVERLKEQLPDDDMEGVEGHMAEYCSSCKGETAFKL